MFCYCSSSKYAIVGIMSYICIILGRKSDLMAIKWASSCAHGGEGGGGDNCTDPDNVLYYLQCTFELNVVIRIG